MILLVCFFLGNVEQCSGGLKNGGWCGNRQRAYWGNGLLWWRGTDMYVKQYRRNSVALIIVTGLYFDCNLYFSSIKCIFVILEMNE